MIAKMLENGKMAVEFGGVTREFDAFQGRDGMEAAYVFAAPFTRNGKDWPVNVIVKADGTSAISVNHAGNHGRIRIAGFWADSENQSKHSKV